MPRGADFKNTGLVKSTPSGTVCLGGGPRLGPCGPSPTGVVWAGPKVKEVKGIQYITYCYCSG